MIVWTCKPFSHLSLEELYAILKLRSEIFVVEQNCVFQDMDGKDAGCQHLMGWMDNELVAYARLLPQGLSFKEQSIGRVVVKKETRNTGLGHLLMKEAVNRSHHHFGKSAIRIGAQLYLRNFYESLGFVPCSEVYDEDGIDHIEMIHDNNQSAV